MIWQLHLEILIYLISKFIGLHCIKLFGNLGSPFKKHLKNWTTKFKARTSGLNKFLLISFFYHLILEIDVRITIIINQILMRLSFE